MADAGIEFAIIRVGYRGYGTGTIEEDTSYYTNIEGALAAGLQVGVYFYSQAITTAEAREEAQFVLDHLGGYEITYPVIFDWEQSSEAERTASLDNTALTDCAIAFCDTIEARGYRAGCYFNQYFGYDRFDRGGWTITACGWRSITAIRPSSITCSSGSTPRAGRCPGSARR